MKYYTIYHLLSGSPLLDTFFTPPPPPPPPPRSIRPNILKTLLFLFLASCLCACNSENISEPFDVHKKESLAITKGDTLCASQLEKVSSWKVVSIIKKEGIFNYNISRDGTKALFTNGEVSFYVPYTSVSFDGKTTTDNEHYGPYTVEYTASNILFIADVSFRISASSNDVYTLTSENLEIKLEK